MMRLRTLLTTLFLLLVSLPALAQNDARTEAQRRVVEDLERKVAAEEAEIASLKLGRSASEGEVRRLVRQIGSRNQLLEETETQARLLREEIARKDSLSGNLSDSLERARAQYAAMVREAYRNYRQQNYLTYLFSSRDFSDVMRRLAALREMADLRERKMAEIEALGEEVSREKEALGRRHASLDSVTRKVAVQKELLERDVRNARASVQRFSQRERAAMARKLEQERQLAVAVSELRRLTKGNTEGATFSKRTSGLRLPVVEGRVVAYNRNMAEIAGAKGARVISIYEGKVIDIQRNRITNKYEVYVAHGEYVTSYANMGSICVEKGQKVAKNQQLGTIGSEVDIQTMKTVYKLLFGIFSPNPAEVMMAEKYFKK